MYDFRLEIIDFLKKELNLDYKKDYIYANNTVLDGEYIDYIPADNHLLERCQPVYLEMNGWKEDITNVKSFKELPLNAQQYIEKIEELIDVKVKIFSVGPDKLQTIVRENIF